MAWAEDSALGKSTGYRKGYDPAVLCPLDRIEGRRQIGIDGELPFHGVDVWRNYEVSWLDAGGKPAVAIATILVPAESPCLIESKSLKLYFNSLNFERFTDASSLVERVELDLGVAAQATVQVRLSAAGEPFGADVLPGECLDDLPVTDPVYHPDASGLTADASAVVTEVLHSHLLRTNCPVTGQPDWGSVVIEYHGPVIDRSGLLRYLVSYREHNDFHEQCVERIFNDIRQRCRPLALTVYACYTRRGGLDINPYRTSGNHIPESLPRLLRQ